MTELSSAAGVVSACELCQLPHLPSVRVVAELPELWVLRVLDAPNFPAFYRVVWRAHVAEWTDLSAAHRLLCLEAVAVVEQALRDELSPSKINLASLGNMVPHLHWHVVARFAWDSHFPQPIWGEAQRAVDGLTLSKLLNRMGMVDNRIARALPALLAKH